MSVTCSVVGRRLATASNSSSRLLACSLSKHSPSCRSASLTAKKPTPILSAAGLSAQRSASGFQSRHYTAASSSAAVMDRFKLPQQYKGTEANVWVEFIQLALETKPLNLGQGFPDDLVPDYIPKTLAEVASESILLNQYTRGFGHPRLISALCKVYDRLLERPESARLDGNREILVTDGAYEALFAAILGLVDKGDEVIIVEPYFDCYEPMVKLAGGTPKYIALKPTKTEGVVSSADWKLDFDELESLFSDKTKVLIINNPNNPLGKVYKREELDRVADLAKKYNVAVISDEVYEHMVFEGSEMVRMATLPGMWERTISIGSAGKTFSVTGWKLGWAIGPANLVRNCQIVHQNAVYTCPTPIQEAVARGFELELARMDKPECYFNSIAVDLQRKRDYIAGVLTEVGLTPVVPEGGYFIMADWSKLADKIDLSSEKDSLRDYRFVKWLSRNKKLQGIPPSAFFNPDHKAIGENYIRFCFIKHDDSLRKAEKILKAWRKELD